MSVQRTREAIKWEKNLLRLERKDGYTQEQMANKLDVARTTYTGYENGNFAPSLETALHIKRILRYNNDDIFLISSDSITNTKINQWKVGKNVRRRTKKVKTRNQKGNT